MMFVLLRFVSFLLSIGVIGCASRLQIPDAFPSHNIALDSMAMATAIQHGLRTAHPRGDVRLVCVTLGDADPEPALLAGIRSEGVTLRPGSACDVEKPIGRGTDRSLVVLRAGGELRGISVNVGRRIALADSGFTFQVSYYQNFSSAGDWRCSVRRREKSWVLHSCQLTRIS